MENELICYCKQITKKTVILAISKGAKTLKEIQKLTTACTGNQCKELNPKGVCCSSDINKLLPPKQMQCSCHC